MNNDDFIKKIGDELLETIKSDTGVEIRGLIRDGDYSEIVESGFKNVVGYRKIPMGVSDKSIIINGIKFFAPICTTEGSLVTSMCRGIELINAAGGVNGYVENLGITRSFSVRFEDFDEAMSFYRWIKVKENVDELKRYGEMDSRYCKIKSITSKYVFGPLVYFKVTAFTEDAMGMNMVTNACDQIARRICELSLNAKLVCINANVCTDKKWSIENYCNGRGRRVFLNIKIKEEQLKSIMKVSIDDFIFAYNSKIVIGSSLVLGGFNCQAANYVAATFLAFGQDLGNVIESSNCIITMDKVNGDLNVCLLMPSLVVGLLGGGTHLEPAKSMLEQFNYIDDHVILESEDNSKGANYLALLIASVVLAGELSCLAAITENSLLEAHMRLNRKK